MRKDSNGCRAQTIQAAFLRHNMRRANDGMADEPHSHLGLCHMSADHTGPFSNENAHATRKDASPRSAISGGVEIVMLFARPALDNTKPADHGRVQPLFAPQCIRVGFHIPEMADAFSSAIGSYVGYLGGDVISWV